jgi:hypothetical protein
LWTRPPVSQPNFEKVGKAEDAKRFAHDSVWLKSPVGSLHRGTAGEYILRRNMRFSEEQTNLDLETGYWTVTGRVEYPDVRPWLREWKVVAHKKPSDQIWEQISCELRDPAIPSK